MKNTQHYVNLSTNLFLSILLITVASCSTNKMSIHLEDPSKGVNGSFEYSEEGFPVNWQLYTPQTVTSGDFDIVLDTTDFKEGKQSLKFIVRECSATGGWRSPGIAKQMNANSGETYKISFWIKNHSSSFIIKIAGVSATDGISETIVQSSEQINDWKQYEYSFTIPKKMNAIRFELNILGQGTFWIDDIKIER